MRVHALALVLLGGCSFVFVSGPPAHAVPPVSCTESRIAPIADTGIAGLALIGAIAGLASSSGCNASQSDCLPSDIGHGFANDAGGVLLLTSLVFALSAAHGFSETSACRQAVTPSPAARAPS